MAVLNKVIFCGTPDFAVPILNECISRLGNQLVAVITRPDAPAGRGRALTPSPVKTCGINHSIPTYTPTSTEELASLFDEIQPDLVIVVAFGMLFPKSIVNRYYCMNIHGSILPQYRGASPIHSALLNGDKETGITLIKMKAKMDAGDMIMIGKIPIKDTDYFQSVHDALSQLAAQMCIQFIEQFENNTIQYEPQNSLEATYCHKLSSSDYELRYDEMSADEMMNRVRTFSPNPGAYMICNGRRVKIIHAQIINSLLVPTIVRPEGRADMAYSDYLRGNPPLFGDAHS